MELATDVWAILARNPDTVALASAILLGSMGALFSHLSALRARRFEAQLAHVTAQCRDLYGPLFLHVEANDASWAAFRADFRPGRLLTDPADPLDAAEKAEYLRWLENVFMPRNEKMRAAIETSPHLFIGGKVPGEVLAFLTHLDDLEVVMTRLRDGSGDTAFTRRGYPSGLGPLVRTHYQQVSTELARLSAKRG
ncbi:MAG: hypothetical protein MRY63_05995 [Neomegalonema sp.]|nr:hypothetical protein [Neomegalonema sp.]